MSKMSNFKIKIVIVLYFFICATRSHFEAVNGYQIFTTVCEG